MNDAEDMEQTGNSSLTGVFAAALTPMGGDLDPDHAAFVAHCRRLLDVGCHGLDVFGTTAEANSLSV
jgi:4-hydroxy-tetrahydrodipicolinate synthase